MSFGISLCAWCCHEPCWTDDAAMGPCWIELANARKRQRLLGVNLAGGRSLAEVKEVVDLLLGGFVTHGGRVLAGTNALARFTGNRCQAKEL